MELPENLVSAPAANQLDYITVYSCAEEFNGTSGAEGAGKHVLDF